MRYSRSIKQQVPTLEAASGARALVAQAGTLVAAAAGILLCGGMPQGSLGVFLGFAAIMLVFIPPTSPQPVVVWVIACVVIGAGGLSLLPSSFLEAPPWRQAMIADGSVGALDHISVVPEETLFWLSILASTLVVGIYLLSQPVGSAAMLGLAAGASLFCAAYSGLAVYAESTGWQSAFDAGPSFGFFANRNHVATLLITGTLTGLGVLTSGVREQKPLALLCGAVGVSACAWTILFVSPSRAGVFLLVTGFGMWLAGLGRGTITRPVLVTSLTLLGVVLVFFLGIDNPAARRIFGEWGASPLEALSSDYRLKVYQDALRLWSEHPLTGAGLGSYRFLYPFYAEVSSSEVTTIHPESDWLFLGLEAGPLAIAGVLALLICVSWRVFALRLREGWGVRWSLLTAATIALIHGVFDVPLHRIELGWWVMVLLCLGLGRHTSPQKVTRGFYWQRVAFAIFGIFIGVLAGLLISAEWFGGRPFPPYAAKAATKHILETHATGHIEEALNLAISESRRSPMEKDLHYQRGVLALHFEGTENEVDAAFNTAKLLSPNWPRLPREMGKAWYQIDKNKAAELWLESVRRQAKIDKGLNHDEAPGAKLYGDILAGATKDPEAIQSLRPPPSFAPALHFSWIRAAADGGSHILGLTGNPEFLASMTDTEKTDFLALWSSRGDNRSLEEFLQSHQEWEEAAWAIRIQKLVGEKNYKEAAARLSSRFSVSLVLPSASGPFESPLEKEYVEVVLSRNQVAARRILSEALQAGGKRRTVAHRLAAASAVQAGDWTTAYKELIAHLKSSGQKLPSNL